MRVEKEYQDTNILQILLGSANSNLKFIEDLLEVDILHKGNKFVFQGDDAKKIASFFDSLYQFVEKEQYLDEVAIEKLYLFKEKSLDKDIAYMRVKTKRKVIIAKTIAQNDYLKAIDNNSVVFGIGPAGTGKTYLAVAKAVEYFLLGKVERILLCRPAVEAGESLGYLPGTMQDKVDPFLRPLYDSLESMLPIDFINKSILDNKIEIAPLAYMRGRTLNNSFIIVDEAQNTTKLQLKMLLTRIGHHSKMVITGDLTQIDLKDIKQSGLLPVMSILQGIKGIKRIDLTSSDILRSAIVTKIVNAFNKEDGN